MTVTIPGGGMLSRVRRYAQWATRIDDVPLSVQEAMVSDQLAQRLRRDHLTVKGGTQTHLDESGKTLLVEVSAYGLPPEERLPQGWRRWFMAP